MAHEGPLTRLVHALFGPSPWPPLATGAVLGSVAITGLALASPEYRHLINPYGHSQLTALSAQARAVGSPGWLYVNLVMGLLITGPFLLVTTGFRWLARAVHFCVAIGLGIFLARPLLTAWPSERVAVLPNLILLSVSLATGVYLLLKPRRLWPRSYLPVRNMHLAAVMAYATRFFGEPFIGALFGRSA
jgi:hypothetical protein